MAHYLHRAFATDADIHVLHNLRLEDTEQPEHDGSPGACQIDHLIVHRRGMFIVESKSVTEEVRIRSDGAGGDEWSRVYKGRSVGMASPVQQATRQSEFLRAFLQRHRDTLLGKKPVGLRTLAKALYGTDRREFGYTPIQLIVAVSDKGRIERLAGWKEPREPFRVFVSKADLVPDKITKEIARHRGSLLKDDEYGSWSMKPDEVVAVAEFLASRHAKRHGAGGHRSSNRVSPAHSPTQAEAACKGCGAHTLSARWGRYGYYWKCQVCDTNTAMPTMCSSCQTEGRRGHPVRVRKEGGSYYRACSACGHSEVIWMEATQGGS